MADALAPNSRSKAAEAMLPMLDKIDAILGGVESMRAGKEKYLPKLPNESQATYDHRVGNAPFTNIYRDIAEGLCSRLFRDEIALKDDADQTFKDLSEDIDGHGNNLHVFSAQTGWTGINHGISWILVDYTKAAPGRTVADEKASGARPYWVLISQRHMLAVYSGVVQGKEIIVHARISEPVTVRDGYGEKTIERVRILNREPIYGDAAHPTQITGYMPATWELFQQGDAKDLRNNSAWESVGKGPITIGIIPLVPYLAGRRVNGTWQVRPPLKDAADKQVEHYQRETNLWSIEERTAFPMLAGNGVEPDKDEQGNPKPIPVGAYAVLYAPPAMGDNAQHGSWDTLEPQGTSLLHLKNQVEACEKGLRELGKQPLTASSGNLTVVANANAADKAISVCEAWGLNLKDALELAWVITALWLNQTQKPEVVISLANLLLDLEGSTEFQDLLTMRDKGDLSQDTLWSEAKRRGRLSPEFDPKKEKAAIIAEMPEGDGEEIDPLTGLPIVRPAPAPAPIPAAA